MLALAVAGFLAVRYFGQGLAAPVPAAGQVSLGAGNAKLPDALPHVLLALALVIVTARAVGALFTALHQPPVIGEVLAGIFLGPSLLGRLAPTASAYVLPASVAPFLSVLSQVGVILYMFLVGLELDLGLIRNRTHATVAISHASIIAPFLLGTALSLLLYPLVSSSDVPFTAFALFCGVSMSVTAFPVLARILTDRQFHRTRVGTLALTCAAVDDVTAWCLLAFVVSVVNARLGGALRTLGFTLGFIAAMVFVVRPSVRRLVHWQESRTITKGVMTVVFVALLVSALVTEAIGIHAVFGAFLLGLVIPHDSAVARSLAQKLEDVVVVLLLPAFFAYTGMRTQIGLVSGATQWLLCALVVATASAGKFGGTCIAARVTGLPWRDAAALGVLMNTRGLMELIVLNIGLDLRLISPTLFAMMVLMALVTTMSTTPIMDALRSRAPNVEDQANPRAA